MKSRIDFFMNGFRAKAAAAPAGRSRGTLQGQRPASSTDLQFSAHEHSLKDLWAECDTKLSNDKLFPFLEAFSSFPHDEQMEITGHPPELVHRLAAALLDLIRIRSLTTNEVWSAERFLFLTRKDLNLVVNASIRAEIITFSTGSMGQPPPPPSGASSAGSTSGTSQGQHNADQLGSINPSLLTVSNRRFLLLLHAVVKLSTWPHNRHLLIDLLGTVFYAIPYLLFPTLLIHLDELIARVSGMPAADLEESGIMDELAFLLSVAMAIAQLPAVIMETDSSELLGGLSISRLPPFKFGQLDALGVDYLLRAVPIEADSTAPTPLDSSSGSSSNPTIFRAKSTAPSAYTVAAKKRHQEDMYASWLQHLSALLRRLYLLSGMLAGEEKHMSTDSLHKLFQFVIIVQCEVVHALCVLLFAHPSLLPAFQTCEGLNIVGALILCKDSKVMRSDRAQFFELIFSRTLLVILCHSVCLRNKWRPGQGKSIVAECLSMLSNLSPLLSVLTDSLQSELAERHVEQPLLAECAVPVHLRTGMPASDPWQNVPKSSVMFTTAMTGLGQGEEDCQPAAFTSVMQGFAKVRMNFLPANTYDVFEPCKSYIFAHLERRALFKNARDAEPTATSEDDPLGALYKAPSMRYMEELFDVLYAFVWAPSAQPSAADNNIFLEACLSSCLATMSGQVNHLGEVGSILQVLLFMMRCLSGHHPEQTQRCIEQKAIWRSLLDVNIGSTVFTKGMVMDTEDLTMYKVKIGNGPVISPADPAGAPLVAEEDEDKRAPKCSRLLLFYRLLLIDMIFEGLWLSCTTSAMHLTASIQSAAPADEPISVSMLSEVRLLGDFVASNKSDLALVYAFRWLSSLCLLCNHMFIGTTPVLWEGIVDRALDCLRYLEGSMRPESGILLWPAKAAVVVFIARCLYASPASAWIGTFLSPTLSAQAIGLQGRCTKHNVLVLMIMDNNCRDYAVAIVMRLFTACAANKPIATSTHIREHTVTAHEALAHDILKHICNFITSPEGSQGAGSALLHGLVTVLRTKTFRHEEDRIELCHIRRLFASYGQATSIHKQLFGWTHHRLVIVKDLVASLAHTLTKTTISYGFVELVKHTLTLFVALSADSIPLQGLLQMLCNDTRRLHSTAPVLPASAPSLHPTSVTNKPCNDLVFVILSSIRCKQQFVLFFGLCMEMLCNGLPAEAVGQLRGASIQGEHFFVNLESVGGFMICNTAALSLLFALCPHFSTSEQSYAFESLIFLLQRARDTLRNISVVLKCRPSLIDMILEVFPLLGAASKQQATRLLQLMGRFAISVAELKRMIRCLLHEPVWLVQALQGTIAPVRDPQFYFLLEGNEAGILLPAFETFPGQSGYSFSTWIQLAVDWRQDAETGFRERIYMLFSCRQSNGVGVDIYISLTAQDSVTSPLHAMLWMDVYTSTRPHLSLRKALGTIPIDGTTECGQRWTFIGISHTKAKFLSHSSVVAVVNSSVYRVELSYPRFDDSGSKFAAIGRVHPQVDQLDNVTYVFAAAATSVSLHGYLATIYIFAKALSEAVLLQICHQGLLRSAELSEVMENCMGIDSAGIGIFKKAIVLEYNPSVATTDLVVDTLEVGSWGALESFDTHMGAGKMHGRLLAGTHIFSSHAMKNALDCLGGSKVLFPLLCNVEKGQFVTVLSMIRNSLQTDESKLFMVQHGFAFISLFLESIDPQSITAEMVDEMIKFIRLEDVAWSKECIRKLFCNFSLWVLTPYLTQEHVLRFLSAHIDFLSVGVHDLCHALYFQYSGQPGSRMAQSGRMNSAWVAKWSSAFPLTSDELRLLREYVLQIIYQLMTSKPDLIKEVSSIIGYVIQESQASHKVDGLQLLVRLLAADKPDLARRLINGIVSCKGLLVLASLCDHVCAKVRLYTWLVLTNVINVSLTCDLPCTALDSISLHRESVVSRSSTAGTMEWSIFTKLGVDESTLSFWLLHLVKLTLGRMQSTLDAYSVDIQVKVLFRMLHLTMYGQVGKFLLPLIEQVPLNKTVPTVAGLKHEEECDCEYEEIFSSLHLLSIPMVFRSLAELIKCAPIASGQRNIYLQHISDTLNGIENLDIFMSIPKWQALLLDMLVAEKNAGNRTDEHGLQEAVGNIMTKCHVHSAMFGDLRNPIFVINSPRILLVNKHIRFDMMQRDRRTAECGCIRKTMAMIRAYITAGSLDRHSFDLLTVTVEGLQAATRQIQELELHDFINVMRNGLPANVWLTVECVCELITAVSPIFMMRGRSSILLGARAGSLGSITDHPQTADPESFLAFTPKGDLGATMWRTVASMVDLIGLVGGIMHQSIWLLLRIVSNFALQGAGQLDCSTVDSIAVQALRKLSIVLMWAKTMRAVYDEESLVVLAKLTLALQAEQGMNNDSLWKQLALQIVDEIMLAQARFLSLALRKEPKSGSSLSRSVVTISAPLTSLALTSPEGTVSSSSGSDISFYLQQRIAKLLGISLSWADWLTLMESYSMSAIDHEINSSQLDEVVSQLELHRRAGDDAIAFYSSGMDRAWQRAQFNEAKALKDHIRCEIQGKKAIEYDWQDTLSSLAYERGPWGSGALDDEQQVSSSPFLFQSNLELMLPYKLWMVDSRESNLRMKCKLVSHEAGRGYLNSFLTSRATELFEANGGYATGMGDHSGIADPDGQNILSGHETDVERSSAIQTSPRNNTELDLNFITILKELHGYRANSVASDSSASDSDENIEDGPDEDEDTAKEGSQASGLISVAAGEKILFRAPAEVVLPSSNPVNPPASGTLEVTRSTIRFIRTSEQKTTLRRQETVGCDALWACASFPSTTWATADIVNILQRHYLQRFVAVELFTTDRKVYFINLFQTSVANHLQQVLRRKCKPPHMQPFLSTKPMRIIQKETWNGQSLTAAWANREITNFEYLMRLNTIAGRTYNDLGQYPIFPWVLADYESDVLNLHDRNSFRDLRWPVGAQNVKQREILMNKYNDTLAAYDPDDDTSLPPFHQGTHYSVPGFVLWFLMRLEPYTSLHVQHQDGRFDRPDRLLKSVEAAWKASTSDPSAVKELIPEMFYCPELLVNVNAVDMGRTQSGQPIGDVVLPPWAKNPHDFMRQHREALESEYVSMNLHHWIDLIFGVKARPPHLVGGNNGAVDACNVFFHLTYERAVDLDHLRDSNPLLYVQYVDQISELGQTPVQLFSKEHISRCPLNSVDFIWPIASIVPGVHTMYEREERIGMPRRMIAFVEIQASISPLLTILEDDDRIITVDAQRIVGCHAWQAISPDAVPPCKIRVDSAAYDMSRIGSSHGLSRQRSASRFSVMAKTVPKLLGVPFAPRLADHTFTRLVIANMSRATNTSLTCDYRPTKVRSYEKDEKHERSRQLANPETNNNLHAYAPPVMEEHISARNFVFLSDWKLLLSCGHWDCSIHATSLDGGSGSSSSTLRAHRDVVTCLATAKDYGKRWLASGSRDCTVILWEMTDMPVDSAVAHVRTQGLRIGISPIRTLYGHDDSISMVLLLPEIDALISAAEDGTVIVHGLREGGYVRTIVHQLSNPSAGLVHAQHSAESAHKGQQPLQQTAPMMISWLGYSVEGYLVVYSAEPFHRLSTFSLNGALLCSRRLTENLHAILLSEDGKVLITGGTACLVVLRWVHDLEFANDGPRKGLECVLDGSTTEYGQMPFQSPIRSLHLSKRERHLLVGLEGGQLRVLAHDADYLRERLHRKNQELGIL